MIVHTSVKVGIAGFLKALVNIVNKGFFRFRCRCFSPFSLAADCFAVELLPVFFHNRTD